MVIGLDAPVSPWRDGGLQRMSQVSLTDREACDDFPYVFE